MLVNDGLTRDSSGKRTDKTGTRDLTFNNWHRKYLSRRCYATDIDFYEYRYEDGDIIPKAFLEVKQSHVRQKKYIASSNVKAVYELARKSGLRFCIVLYKIVDEEQLICDFWVWEIKNLSDIDSYEEDKFHEFFKHYSNDEFREFLENL